MLKAAHLSEPLLEYMCICSGVRCPTVPGYQGELAKAMAGHVGALKAAPQGVD